MENTRQPGWGSLPDQTAQGNAEKYSDSEVQCSQSGPIAIQNPYLNRTILRIIQIVQGCR